MTVAFRSAKVATSRSERRLSTSSFGFQSFDIPIMGLFDKLKQGLKKTTQLLNTDVRDLFKAEGRLVDDSFRNDLFEWLVKIDMGVDAAQEIADEIGEKFRARVVQEQRSSTTSRPSSRRCWPSRPSRSASPPAGRPSSWWPASTAAARPPRSPS